MRKKTIAAMMTATMIATLVGCGGNNNTQDTSSTGSNANTSETNDATDDTTTDDVAAEPTEVTDITLKVWCPQNQKETGIIEEQEAAFQELHPEWNITWVTELVGEDNAKTELLKDVDAGPDVFFFASDQLPELVDAGAIAQLGGDALTLVETTMSQAVQDTAKIGDATYAIPFTHNTFFMYYDKSIMSEEDVTSLENIMAKETADDVYNFYFESSGGWKLGAYYYGAGLTVFGPNGDDVSLGCDWNSQLGVDVTNYLIDLINNPKCAYDGEIAVSELIESHRIGVWFDGSWNYEQYESVLGDDLGLAKIPTFNVNGTDYQMLGFYGSKCIGVNSHSQNMAAAVAFATFLGNEENQTLRFEKSNQVPTNLTVGESDLVASNELAAVIVEEANVASVMQPVNSVFSARYWTYANAIPTEIRSGEITKDNVQQKLDDFVNSMTAE